MSKRDTPKVVRQEVKWVPLPESRNVRLEGDEHPYRVWTVYDHTDLGVPPTLPLEPRHHEGFFLEDYLHDWTVSKDGEGKYLRYGSRLVGEGVWILLEYTEPGKCPWGRK
jgi:hypothetical protein